MAERLVWLDGALRPVSEAVVPLLSPTAQFGLNVFEGIRAYWSAEEEQLSLFRLDDHLRRLLDSAKVLGLVSPWSQEEIADAVHDAIAANGYQEDTSVRVLLFVGGEGSWRSSEPVGLVVAPMPQPRRSVDDLGQTACTSTWVRIGDRSLPPRVKAGANYLNGRYAQLEATRNGFDVPILAGPDGHIAESAGSCLMMVRDGVLVTPPVYGSILVSLTRHTLLELARRRLDDVVERPIDRSELYLADEVLLCGTAAEVTPIISLDNLSIGTGSPGPIARGLLEDYHALLDGRDESWPEWRTAVRRPAEGASAC